MGGRCRRVNTSGQGGTFAFRSSNLSLVSGYLRIIYKYAFFAA